MRDWGITWIVRWAVRGGNKNRVGGFLVVTYTKAMNNGYWSKNKFTQALGLDFENHGKENWAWSKLIPISNYLFMVLYVAMLMHLYFSIQDANPMAAFFKIFISTIPTIHFIFLCLENFVFGRKFKRTYLGYDSALSLLILSRNLFLAFLLTLTSPISIAFSTMFVMSVGWIPALIYLLMIIARFRETKDLKSGEGLIQGRPWWVGWLMGE
jgi:hypothetical protein